MTKDAQDRLKVNLVAIEGTGKRARLARVALELARLRAEAAELGEDFLAFLIAHAHLEAENKARGGWRARRRSQAEQRGPLSLAGGPTKFRGRVPMDFSKIDDDFKREIIREAESYIGGQVSIATSADQRAAVMASVFAAAGAALAAGTMTVAGTAPLGLVLGGMVAAALFLGGAFLCVRASMPVDFYLPGAEPHNWDSDVASGRKLGDVLGEQAGHFQERIAHNNGVIEKNARWFAWGARAGIAAPIAGFVVWGLLTACKAMGAVA